MPLPRTRRFLAPRYGRSAIELMVCYRLELLEPRITLSADAALIDDHGDNYEAATPITDLHTPGKLERVGDTDWFSFEAVAGTSYRVGLSAPDGTDILAELELWTTDLKLTLRLDASYGSRAFSALRTGIHYIRIQPHPRYPDRLSNYTLHLRAMIDEAGSTTEQAAPWSLSDLLEGDTHSEEDVDVYSFYAAEGNSYVINTSGLQRFTVVSGDESQTILVRWFADDYSFTGWTQWTAPYSGIHHLSVGQFRGIWGVESHGGPYTISATPIPDPDAHGSASSRPLTPGEKLTGHLDHPAAVDWYRLDAEPGTYYTFSTSSLSGSRAPILQVVDATGKQVPSDSPWRALAYNAAPMTFGWAGFAPTFEWVAPNSGPYYITLSSERPLVMGEYTIGLTAIPDDHRNTEDHATHLEPGSIVRGSSSYWLDDDVFSFDGVAGKTYVLYSLHHGDSSRAASLHLSWLYPASATHYRWDEGRVQFTVTESGPQYFYVTDGADYEILLIEMTGDISAAKPLAPSRPVTGILPPAHVEYFTFDAFAGDEFALSVPADSAVPRLAISVLGEGMSGTERYSQFASNTWSWAAPKAGTYYLAIASDDPRASASYSFTVLQKPDSHGPGDAVSLELDRTVQDRLSSHQDSDWFAIDTAAGYRYEVTIRTDHERDLAASVLLPMGATWELSSHSQQVHGAHLTFFSWISYNEGIHYFKLAGFSRSGLDYSIDYTLPPDDPEEPVADEEDDEPLDPHADIDWSLSFLGDLFLPSVDEPPDDDIETSFDDQFEDEELLDELEWL